MSQKERKIELSESEIRALYAQGEEAVVSLVMKLLEQVEKLELRIEELEGRAKKTSSNSSKPPSGDGFGKKTKSLRSKSDRESGGQKGHQGKTLEWSEEIDEVERHQVSECLVCGESLAGVPVEMILHRQVFDIPPMKLRVKEHQVEVKSCRYCGHHSQGSFPAEASNVVQYGPRLKAMMVYLMEGQLLPSKRSCEVLSDLLGVSVSEGTLYTTRTQCFENLELIEEHIQASVVNSKVVHFDETGMRVNGQLWWLHVACTDGLTYYFVHPKRGQTGIDAMAILPKFGGKAIHDGWKIYMGYGCEHFLCNAHHLRELQFVLEHYGQWWAYQLSLLLVTILCQVQTAKAQGQRALPVEQLHDFELRYCAILEQGFAANPIPSPPPDTPKKRGRPKQSPPFNLLARLRPQQSSVLVLCMTLTFPSTIIKPSAISA